MEKVSKMNASRAFVPALLLAALTLGACSGVKEQLGLTKQSPDEFRVMARAPLSMPPDYSLRPPEPGMARPQEGSPTDQARTAVFGIEDNKGQSVAAAGNGTDQAFLQAAQADLADPQIRQVVNAETRQINTENQDFLETLIFWRKAQPPGVVVDPEKEQQRIRETQALGEPVTTGETPIIQRRQQGIFEGIF